MHLKLLQKRAIQKTAEATGDSVGNKIADKVTKVFNTSPKTVKSETEKWSLIENYQKEI